MRKISRNIENAAHQRSTNLYKIIRDRQEALLVIRKGEENLEIIFLKCVIFEEKLRRFSLLLCSDDAIALF